MSNDTVAEEKAELPLSMKYNPRPYSKRKKTFHDVTICEISPQGKENGKVTEDGSRNGQTSDSDANSVGEDKDSDEEDENVPADKDNEEVENDLDLNIQHGKGGLSEANETKTEKMTNGGTLSHLSHGLYSNVNARSKKCKPRLVLPKSKLADEVLDILKDRYYDYLYCEDEEEDLIQEAKLREFMDVSIFTCAKQLHYFWSLKTPTYNGQWRVSFFQCLKVLFHIL